jgi:hypothetical protein
VGRARPRPRPEPWAGPGPVRGRDRGWGPSRGLPAWRRLSRGRRGGWLLSRGCRGGWLLSRGRRGGWLLSRGRRGSRRRSGGLRRSRRRSGGFRRGSGRRRRGRRGDGGGGKGRPWGRRGGRGRRGRGRRTGRGTRGDRGSEAGGGRGGRGRARGGRRRCGLEDRFGEGPDGDALEGPEHEVPPDEGGHGAPGYVGEPRHVVQGELPLPVPHPHAGRELGDVAAEPGVHVVLGRARLAGGGTADVRVGPGAGLDDPLEGKGDEVRGGRIEGPPAVGAVAAQDLPVGGLHPLDGERRVVGAAGGERGVGGGHLERGHGLGPQGDRAHRPERGDDPHPVGHLDHPLGPHRGDQLSVDRVHGVGRGVEEGHGPVGGVPVVGDLPRLSAWPGAPGVVHDERGRPPPHREQGDALLHRGGQGERLERGPGLAAGLDGQVELVPSEVPPAH